MLQMPLRAAKPQVLWSHLVLQMPCRLPSRRYWSHLVLQMPCRLPTRRYFGATWCLKCPAGCQPAGTLEPLAASNALRAANPQVLWRHLCFKCPAGCQAAGTLETIGASNALRAANPQVLWSHLVLQMPCKLPSRRYFGATGASNALRAANPRCFGTTWCFKCPVGCQPAEAFSPFSVCEFTTGVRVLSCISCDPWGLQASVTSFDVLNDNIDSAV